MNDKIEKEVQTLPPFKKFCMTIGELPTSYFDSMTYYESLTWFVNYLQNTVIPAINNNAEALTELQNLFVELQTYVNDYFENLDVQQEINNKLDEMTENGTLQEIFSGLVTDLFNTEINPIIEQQNTRIANVESQVSAVASGSPLVASSTSDMTETDRIYVNTTDGKWYYYDGTNWTAGGTYQSTGIGDGTITEKMLSSEVINDFNLYKIIRDSSGAKRIGQVNTTTSLNSCVLFPTNYLPKGTIIEFLGDLSTYRWQISELGVDNLVTSDETTLSASQRVKDTGWKTDSNSYITSFDGYVCLTYGKSSASYEITEDELNNIVNLFQFKIPNEAHNNYLLSIDNMTYGETVINQLYSYRMGTKTNYGANNTAVLIIDHKVPKGSTIKVTQPSTGSKQYRFAIVEATATYGNASSTIVDSGYFTSGEYVTTEEAYLFLTLNLQDVTDLDNDDKAYLYEGFEVIPNSEYNGMREGYKHSVLIQLNENVKGINHRGYNSIAPENTIPAFQLSRRVGFEYVETDVSFTSDNVPVCLHDNTIDRTSNGSGNIGELTYAQVRQFDFGSWKSEAYTGTKIPSFEEFILLCRNIGLKPYIEIKNNETYSESQIQMLVDIVKNYGMKDKVTWISFNVTYLSYIKNYDSTQRLGLLGGSISSTTIENALGLKTTNNEVFLNINHQNLTTEMVTLAISNNLPLEIYTTDSVNNINHFNPYISGMTSNTLIAGNVLYNSNIE